jgi:manganese efflux pump family protein
VTVLRLLAFIAPLSLESFAVAAALGAAGAAGRQRWRITAVFVAFEGGMPMVGLLLGAPLARAVGTLADYLAATAFVGIGLWLLLKGDGEDEEERARRLVSAHGLALLGLGLSISLDELAIGFSLGLVGLPVLAVVVAIAIQAFLAAQLGLALGARITDRGRERAERVAAFLLIALGVGLALAHLTR